MKRNSNVHNQSSDNFSHFNTHVHGTLSLELWKNIELPYNNT